MPGKTISPHLAEKKFIKSGGYFETCNIENLFIIKGNPQLDKEKLSFSKDSSYPYFTRTVFNNGIYGYVDYYDDKHLVKGNSIAVGMMGMQFFYMAHDFYAGQFTKTAFPKFEGFNWRVALWFIAWFNKSSKKYLGLLVRDFEKAFLETEISVPRNSDGSLAIEFMESRIREMEESRIREMEAYLKVSGFENCELTEHEKSSYEKMKQGQVKFKTFYVTDDKKNKRHNGVFNVKNSHNILQSSIVAGSGTTPYVTAGEGNNSIYPYISYDEDQIEEGNAIMIGGKTMVVTYQAEDFFSNDSHNLVLYAKDDKLRNELIQLFMVASLNKSLKPIYSWGDSVSKTKIVKDKFQLPVTDAGFIDYQFMETYIRAVEKLTIQKVYDWRAQEVKTTKAIVNDSVKYPTVLQQKSIPYLLPEDKSPKMVAEDIYIPCSIEIRLQSTKREELLCGNLNLVLMYAIAPIARHKTESACRIALGIKEDRLSVEAIKAFESVRYIMFHYWKNAEATPFELVAPTCLVDKKDIPEGYLIRQEKDAKQFLLIEYNAEQPANISEYNILKVQRKGNSRYIPFVCKLDNIKVDLIE